MFKKLLLLGTLLTGALFAQSETITGTILNADGTALAGGVLTAQLTNSSGVSYDQLPYNPQTANVRVQQISTILDSNGAFSFNITSNAQVTNSQWTFTVCSPRSDAQCAKVTQQVIANTNLSTALNAAISAALNTSGKATVAYSNLNAVKNIGSSITSGGLNAGVLGINSTYYGRNAGSGQLNTFGSDTFYGFNAGASCTNCSESTIIGSNAGNSLDGDGTNETTLVTLIGSQAGTGLLPGTATDEVMIGQKAGLHVSSGISDTFVGTHTGYGWTTSQENTFVGRGIGDSDDAGGHTSSGIQNAIFGSGAFNGYGVKNGNVAIGYQSLKVQTVADSNVAIGIFSAATNLTGNHLTCVGANACLLSLGSDLSMFGTNSGHNITSGNQLAFFGSLTGLSCLTCTASGAWGYNADLGAAVTNAYQIGVGQNATSGTLKFLGNPIADTTAIKLHGYTVATLPAGVTGNLAYVTDATTPTYNGTLTGGGAVVVPVFYNGTAWVSH